MAEKKSIVHSQGSELNRLRSRAGLWPGNDFAAGQVVLSKQIEEAAEARS
jgi:hypothetical protein